jgi:hypothetical protein
VHGGQPGLSPAAEDDTRGLHLIEQQVGQLDQEIASLLRQHQDPVERLAEVPGLGVDSAQQIIAEVGAKAATFASAKNLVSWVGACPGDEKSAGRNYNPRSPKGNCHMRRILNQAANAAVKHKGSIFEIVYRRLVPRLGHNKTIGAIAHRLCQLIWIILRNGVRYEERGPAVSEKSRRARTSRMIRLLFATTKTLIHGVEKVPWPGPDPSSLARVTCITVACPPLQETDFGFLPPPVHGAQISNMNRLVDKPILRTIRMFYGPGHGDEASAASMLDPRSVGHRGCTADQ